MAQLAAHITKGCLCDQAVVKMPTWTNERESIVEKIIARFSGLPLIVRSSAVAEDSWDNSLAGQHLSIVNVKPQAADVAVAIDQVFASYMRFHGNGIGALRSAYANLGRVEHPWMNSRSIDGAYLTDLLMELILTDHVIHAVPVDSGWLEIDTVNDYNKTVAMIEDGSISRLFGFSNFFPHQSSLRNDKNN